MMIREVSTTRRRRLDSAAATTTTAVAASSSRTAGPLLSRQPQPPPADDGPPHVEKQPEELPVAAAAGGVSPATDGGGDSTNDTPPSSAADEQDERQQQISGSLLLQPLRSCRNSREQLEALRNLAQRLCSSQEEEEGNNARGSSSSSAAEEQTRTLAAAELIREIAVLPGTENERALFEDALLRGCGPYATLAAAVDTVKRVGGADCGDKFSNPSALAVSLEVIRRVLLSHGYEGWNDDNYSNSRSNSQNELSIRGRWLTELAKVSSAPSPPSQAISYGQQLPLQQLLLEPWIRTIVLLPGTIANASQADCGGATAAIPHWCRTASKFYVRLVECALRDALSSFVAEERQQGNGGPNEASQLPVLYFCSLTKQMLRRSRGNADDVVLGLYNCYINSNDGARSLSRLKVPGRTGAGTRGGTSSLTSDVWKHHFAQLFKGFPPRDVAVLCASLVKHAVTLSPIADKCGDGTNPAAAAVHPWLEFTCIPLLAMSRQVQEYFVNLVVLSASIVCPQADRDTQLCHTVAALLSMTPTRSLSDDVNDEESTSSTSTIGSREGESVTTDAALRRQLTIVSEAWSQSVFAQQADYRTQRHVSDFLLAGLSFLHGATEDPCSPLVASVLAGVTERLHSTIDPIRKDGMRVAERLGKRLGQDLKFDELEEERTQEKLEADKRKQHALCEASTQKEDLKRENPRIFKQTQIRGRRRMKQSDPDEAYASDGDNECSGGNDEGSFYDDDSLWDDDSALDPYDLDDDEEDLRETPRPLYLHDCLDLLRTPESEENAWSKHEAALEALPSLVRARPGDLPDVGATLAAQLLRMENKFNIDNFGSRIVESLRALTVEEPLIVGQILIAEIFEDGSLSDRLTALSTLIESANELSGYKREESSRAHPEARAQEHSGVFDNHALVEALGSSEDGKTRRWGRGRKQSEQASIFNRFVAVAPVWFYSLIDLFWKKKNESSLWGGHIGSTLLARFFITLAVIVENCGLHPSTEVLAKDLFDLVWIFREAEISEVRSSVLCAVGTSLGLLRDETLLPLLFDDSPEKNLRKYLHETAESDPDDICRSLAGDIGRSITNSVRAIEM